MCECIQHQINSLHLMKTDTKKAKYRAIKNIQTITYHRVCLKMLGHIIECNLGYIIKLLELINHVFSIF